MMQAAPISISRDVSTFRCGYLNGSQGKLYVSVYLPDGDEYPSQWIVHVPAFAEEMNKSRPMVSRQSRQFAKAGFGVIVPDLFGTGDSEGDFCDATWDTWKSDLVCVIEWVRGLGAGAVSLWGLRLGCLLAADVVQSANVCIDRMLLWQPVHTGKQHITQFLRLRVAASMMSAERETVSNLRQDLEQDGLIEIAGYLLNSTLSQQIEQASLAALDLSKVSDIQVIEIVSDINRGPFPETAKQIKRWQDLSVKSAVTITCDDSFWMTQEICYAPELLKVTSSLFSTSLQNDGESNTKCLTSLPKCNIDLSQDGTDRKAIVFPCEGEDLVGVLHNTENKGKIGVLVVVGGPQYRVGSHRQFVQLAVALAEQGVPVFRFDYRGMGDASGELAGFENIEKDIHCAIDNFLLNDKSVSEVVICGLCDAATAAGFYAASDSRVVGLLLLNPWVRSESGEAKAYIKHYYMRRVFTKSFWGKVLRGEFEFGASLFSLREKLFDVIGRGAAHTGSAGEVPLQLAERLEKSLSQFGGRVMIILSGNDLTAAEFSDAVSSSKNFSLLLEQKRFVVENYPPADHTFSRKIWKTYVSTQTAQWLNEF